MLIKISDIYVNEGENCRKKITPEKIATLAESIKQKGQIQSVLIRPVTPEMVKAREVPAGFAYDLVAGFRRIRAHQLLGMETIKADVKEMTRLEAYIANFIENIDRDDLTIVEESDFVSRLARLGMTRSQIAKETGRSAGWVQPRLYLTKLPPKVRELAEAGILSADHIRTLYSCTDEEEMWGLIRQIRKQADRKVTKTKIKLRRPAKTRRCRAIIKRFRSPKDIVNLLDHIIQRGVPFGLHTRCLAWAAGNISDNELAIDFQNYCSVTTRLLTLVEEVDAFVTGSKLCEHGQKIKNLLRDLGIETASFYEVPQSGFPEEGEFPEHEQLAD